MGYFCFEIFVLIMSKSQIKFGLRDKKALHSMVSFQRRMLKAIDNLFRSFFQCLQGFFGSRKIYAYVRLLMNNIHKIYFVVIG